MSAFDDDNGTLALERVWTQLITRIKGDAWKLADKVVEELRKKWYLGILERK
jgi:hypothetical protein